MEKICVCTHSRAHVLKGKRERESEGEREREREREAETERETDRDREKHTRMDRNNRKAQRRDVQKWRWGCQGMKSEVFIPGEPNFFLPLRPQKQFL